MLHETPFYPASTAVLVGEWVAVAGAPVLAFGVGAALLARRERRAGGQGTGQGTRATSA
jgi:hypothetical protein